MKQIGLRMPDWIHIFGRIAVIGDDRRFFRVGHGTDVASDICILMRISTFSEKDETILVTQHAVVSAFQPGQNVALGREVLPRVALLVRIEGRLPYIQVDQDVIRVRVGRRKQVDAGPIRQVRRKVPDGGQGSRFGNHIYRGDAVGSKP